MERSSMELIVSDGIDISGPDDEKWMLLRKQFVENQGWMQVDGTAMTDTTETPILGNLYTGTVHKLWWACGLLQ